MKAKFIKKTTLLFLTAFIVCVGCTNETSVSEQLGKDLRTTIDDFNKGFNPKKETKREYIGMGATIIYLKETNQIDSVSIDLHRLLQIQDSLSRRE